VGSIASLPRIESSESHRRPSRIAGIVLGSAAVALLVPEATRAQSQATPQQASNAEEPTWAPSVSVYAYVLPKASDYLQPTVIVDHGRLHLEGRYNYEDRRTGSLFVGSNYQIAEEPSLEITPMLGGVVGRTDGVAPGLIVELTWRLFDLHSESEYVFDLRDVNASFFYSWSELGAALGAHLRVGLAVQRTKVFHTPRIVAIGPWLRVSIWKVDAAVYVFDPFDSTRFLVTSFELSF
jgi:hypothetical protein